MILTNALGIDLIRLPCIVIKSAKRFLTFASMNFIFPTIAAFVVLKFNFCWHVEHKSLKVELENKKTAIVGKMKIIEAFFFCSTYVVYLKQLSTNTVEVT